MRGAEAAGAFGAGAAAEPGDDEADAFGDGAEASASEKAAAGAFGGGDRGGDTLPVARDHGAAPAPRGPRRSLASRAIAFLQASWAELQRVQWPDRRQVAQATAVVLGFVTVAGLYLGAADWVAQKVVNFIL